MRRQNYKPTWQAWMPDWNPQKPGGANVDTALRCCMMQATWHLDENAMLKSSFVTIYKTQRGCGSEWHRPAGGNRNEEDCRIGYH